MFYCPVLLTSLSVDDFSSFLRTGPWRVTFATYMLHGKALGDWEQGTQPPQKNYLFVHNALIGEPCLPWHIYNH